MHPMMADWMEELTNGSHKYSEARRFLDVVSRGGLGSASAAHSHKEWMARAGFSEVHALALKIVRG